MKLVPILAIVVFMLILGCGGRTPVSNQTNTTAPANTTNGTGPVTIIINNQTNQSAEQNNSVQNNTVPTAPNNSIQFTYDPTQPLGIYLIYVGDTSQGDAILIKKGDFNMLVDAGPAKESGKVVDFLKSKGVENIAVLVSTTGDPRRFGGIEAIADNFPIQSYWWPGETLGNTEYAGIAARMANATKQVVIADDGYSNSYDGINFTVINPNPGKLFQDVNNDAMVIRLSQDGFSMLLTSDIQTGAQGNLINKYPGLISTTVLEAPYYGVGSGTANMGIFLNTAKPQVVVISGSADESAANGGSRAPFERLLNMSQNDIKWYDNYDNGTLRITVTGSQYAIDSLGS